ncbi:MAG: hypothetical protein OWS03_04330 [Alicyclobacillaceae bacterium]|nr:hypothetical protein [Alicyclobacillaceae bacterium]
MDKPHVSIDGIEVDLDTFPARSLGIREYKTARANSAGFQALYPKLADEALVAAVEHCLANIGTPAPSAPTYTDALVRDLVPELLLRLKERAAKSL